MLRKLYLGSIAVLALGLGQIGMGCDGLFDETYLGEPIQVIEGALLGETAPDGPVSITVLWMPVLAAEQGFGGTVNNGESSDYDCLPEGFSEGGFYVETPGGNNWVSQSVTLEDKWPASAWRLSLYSPPPADVLADMSIVGGAGRASFGVVTAYRDENENGTFDHGTPIDPPEPIQAMSWASRKPLQMLVFSENARIPMSWFGSARAGMIEPPQGFSMVRWIPADDVVQVLPVSAPVELSLDRPPEAQFGFDVAVQVVACESISLRSELVQPVPQGAEITCETNEETGRVTWTWVDIQAVVGCVYRFRGNTGCLDLGQPAPEDWPCP